MNLRARLLDLHARLSELRDQACMLRDGLGTGRHAIWPHFLDKYDALSKLYAQVTDELDRALLENGLDNFNAIPCGVTEEPAALPDLLRTKLEPEVEREMKELQKGYEKGREGGNVTSRVASYNEFVETALEQLQETREPMRVERPVEASEMVMTANAEIVLQAMANGTGLK